jgi:hypothetical protein
MVHFPDAYLRVDLDNPGLTFRVDRIVHLLDLTGDLPCLPGEPSPGQNLM